MRRGEWGKERERERVSEKAESAFACAYLLSHSLYVCAWESLMQHEIASSYPQLICLSALPPPSPLMALSQPPACLPLGLSSNSSELQQCASMEHCIDRECGDRVKNSDRNLLNASAEVPQPKCILILKAFKWVEQWVSAWLPNEINGLTKDWATHARY